MNPKPSPEVTSRPGTYVLVFRATARKQLTIGRLGILDLKPGTYLYVGSAFGPGGLRSRTGRHQTRNTVKRWHVDYLKPRVQLTEIWFTEDPVHREHQWAGWFAATQSLHVPLRGFGSSDCRCPSHLFHAVKTPDFEQFRTMHSMSSDDPVHRSRGKSQTRLCSEIGQAPFSDTG